MALLESKVLRPFGEKLIAVPCGLYCHACMELIHYCACMVHYCPYSNLAYPLNMTSHIKTHQMLVLANLTLGPLLW